MAVGTIPKPTKLQSATVVGSGKIIIAISTLSFCLQFLFS